jgi:glutathione S-transferase
MLVVHHLENSRSQRVLWLCEELGLEYEIRNYARDSKTRLAPPELLGVHPLGKSPVITDGDRTVAETGAIVEYLIETYGDGAWQPAVGTHERDRYRYWMHAAEGTFMPPFVMHLVFTTTEGPPVPFFLRPVTKAVSGKVKGMFIEPMIKKCLTLMETELGRSLWFAGEDPTGADVMMLFPAEAAAVRSGLEAYPKIQAFLERVHARPAYQRALERGGPYDLAS